MRHDRGAQGDSVHFATGSQVGQAFLPDTPLLLPESGRNARLTWIHAITAPKRRCARGRSWAEAFSGKSSPPSGLHPGGQGHVDEIRHVNQQASQ